MTAHAHDMGLPPVFINGIAQGLAVDSETFVGLSIGSAAPHWQLLGVRLVVLDRSAFTLFTPVKRICSALVINHLIG